MVKAASEFIIRVADLVEAEGRAARAAVRSEGRVLRSMLGRATLGLGMVVVAGGLLVVGICLCLGTVFLVAEPTLGTAGAMLVTGLVAFATAGAVGWLLSRTMQWR